MGIHFSVNQAIRELDKLTKCKTPRFNSSDGQQDLTAKLKRFDLLCHHAKDSWFVSNKKYKQLHSRVVALSYRLGGIRGGKDKLTSEIDHLDDLKSKALKWKQKQIAFGKNPVLTEADERALEDLLRYPDYIPYVNFEHFFKWTLLNHQSVDIYVQFPSLVQRINKCLLSARIGTWGGLGLVEKEGEKDVTLLMEGNPISILDEKMKVTFSKGYTTSIKHIFNSFKNKNSREGTFTYFKNEGVVPWDPNAMGEVDSNGVVKSIDLSDKVNWYKQLRMKDRYTNEEATQRFGTQCTGENFILTLVCKRQIKELNTYGSHSFIRIAIPNEEKTGYDYTYGTGTFMDAYPSWWELPICLFTYSPRATQYPDNNEIYTNREELEFHFSLPNNKGKALLEEIRQDIEDAHAGRSVFQILRKNCSDWGVKKIKKYVGKTESELMDISYLDLEPGGFFGSLLKILKHFPDWFQRASLNLLAFVGGGWHGKTVTKADGTCKTYRLLSSTPWSKKRANHFHHPGKVFHNPTIT